MKITVHMSVSDIRVAISEWVRKQHPELCKGKTVSTDFVGPASEVKAVVTIVEMQPCSGRD